METYQVLADNCNMPKITYQVNGLTAKSALVCAENLSEAFRDVRVICEQTGEIMCNVYFNDGFKKTTLTEVEVIEAMQKIFAD